MKCVILVAMMPHARPTPVSPMQTAWYIPRTESVLAALKQLTRLGTWLNVTTAPSSNEIQISKETNSNHLLS